MHFVFERRRSAVIGSEEKMALVNFSRFATKIANKNSLGLVIRTASHWNKDYKPGPYPTTQAEREAAAKKYGIPIEQYEPYPNDGMGYGDYPKLPEISVDRKDPYYPYDFPDSKRNFGDPISADSDLYSEDRYNNCKLKLNKRRKRILSHSSYFQHPRDTPFASCGSSFWERWLGSSLSSCGLKTTKLSSQF